MAEDLRLTGVVVYVRDLDKSVSFYRELLKLEVCDSAPTAALLCTADGPELILRATGQASSHPLGQLGVQYVVWALPSRDELDRCERVLRDRSAYRDTRVTEKTTLVEGHDPDDIVVMLTYTEGNGHPPRELSARIYAW
jgi:catechol-2,3-dioxygenase